MVCDLWRVVLIVDEIMIGFGRIGVLFVCEYEGVVLDLMCFGKGFLGGFFILVCVGSE